MKARWLLTGGLTAAILGASLWTIWRYQPGGERFQLAFQQLEHSSLPSYVAGNFLTEVQGLSQLPELLDTREAGLGGELAAAFAKHPWVEEVRQVALRPAGRIHVDLAFRVPVALVALHSRSGVAGHDSPRSKANEGQLFLVDRFGIHLLRGPETALLEKDLLLVLGIDQPPSGPPGTPWGLALVQAAAQAAAAVASDKGNLALVSVEAAVDPLQPDVRLRTNGGTEIIWASFPEGHGPGAVSVEEKLRRLRAYRASHGDWDRAGTRYELDLRPAGGIIRKQLPPRRDENR